MNAKFTKTSKVLSPLNFLLSEVVSLGSKMKEDYDYLAKGGKLNDQESVNVC